jgi:hypothetical protein
MQILPGWTVHLKALIFSYLKAVNRKAQFDVQIAHKSAISIWISKQYFIS